MSVPHLDPCLSLPLEDKTFYEIVEKTKDWALMHGAGIRSKLKYDPDALNFAPFTLFPSTFPRKEFEKAVNIQCILNELIHKVAHDYTFLKDSLKGTIQVDDFTGRLFELYEATRKEGVTQPVSLGLVRSDIMLETACSVNGDCTSPSCTCRAHQQPAAEPHMHTAKSICCWKQVEINTIASGFGHLGPMSGAIHRFVLQELGRTDLLSHLPQNDALAGLCNGMLDAWKVYNNPDAVILFVVEDCTYNICDQRFHEFELRRINPDVRVVRRNLTEINVQGQLVGSSKKLVVDGLEVAVVYFRSGYDACQYHGEEEWAARLLMERSLAIKCPSIHYHLAGTKKVQQALARPNVLEHFLKDTKKVEAVREIFTGLYSLDFDKFGDEAIEMALRDPEKFVLKPQREGGGNNIYGVDIKTKLEEMKKSKERTAWILMERILPPTQLSYIIRAGQEAKASTLQELVSELGVFGVVIGDDKHITVNRQVGHMLRSKLSSADEGGVAAGAGCLDSPFLVD